MKQYNTKALQQKQIFGASEVKQGLIVTAYTTSIKYVQLLIWKIGAPDY